MNNSLLYNVGVTGRQSYMIMSLPWWTVVVYIRVFLKITSLARNTLILILSLSLGLRGLWMYSLLSRLRKFPSSLRYHWYLVGFWIHLLFHFQKRLYFLDWTIFRCDPKFLATKPICSNLWYWSRKLKPDRTIVLAVYFCSNLY